MTHGAVHRWYYLADKLGVLVWQDMPAMCGMWEMPGAVGEWYFDGCWVTTVYALIPNALGCDTTCSLWAEGVFLMSYSNGGCWSYAADALNQGSLHKCLTPSSCAL